MSKSRLIYIIFLLAVLVVSGSACNPVPTDSPEGSEQVAWRFVWSESTFRFDGISGTLKVTDTAEVNGGWKFTVEFDSRSAGYGNRSGQVLAQVITHHTSEVTVQAGRVTAAVMDGVWDMVNHQTEGGIEIGQAPIHEVEVYFMKSNPVQVGVHIKGGLQDGCTTFHDAVVRIEGSLINIFVTTQHPHDVSCPAIYTYFEKDINLGSRFTAGTAYTLKVNDFTASFTY
jgi:hypothetical protein